MITHDDTPILGYRDGIIFITSNERPRRVMTDRGDLPKGNKQNANDWFTIGEMNFNVHPYRSDLKGYPVRWSSKFVDGELV